jgi:hypothetical protein
MMDALEQRMFLSAAPAGADPVVIAADKAKIVADLQKIEDDTATWKSTLRDDAKAIGEAHHAGADPAAKQTLLDDTALVKSVLKSDVNAIKSGDASGKQTLVDDLAKLRDDKGDTQAESDDRTKLAADKSALKSNHAAAVAHLKSDKIQAAQLLKADRAAAKGKGNPAVVLAAQDKLKADVASFKQAIADDRATLAADKAKLKTDMHG